MQTALEMILILLTSMVKFALSPLLSLKLGYGLYETMAITGIGGCLGVTLFFLGSGAILDKWESRSGKDTRRSFTRTNKMIVRVKRNQGLNGLAAITPVLISIPLGSILAARYFRHDKRALPVLFSSVLIWDVILSSIWDLAK